MEDYLERIHRMKGVEVTLEGFVLRHGRRWIPKARPPEVVKQPYKQCFTNSQRRIWQTQLVGEGTLTYVEGFAIPVNVGLPMLHAWLVNPAGEVLDLTWDEPERCDYFGVPFRSDFVIRRVVQTNGWWSLLDDYNNGFPLLRGEIPVEKAVKPWKESEHENA